MKQIKVSVPATSANVGSGFDAVGLAVTLYNTATFEESDKLDISAADGTRIPRGESNLVYRSAKSLFDRVGKRMPPLRIVQTNPIPMARGLGSSSACIIAGLLGANRMLGDVLDTQELLTLATAIEGHPDNVAPALLGGLTTSVFEGGQVYSVKREVDPSLCFAAVVPDYKLLTEAARAALPGQIPHRDAVYNLSRAALLPAAFCDGRHDLLPIATEDKLHQPYRIPLMPGSKEVFALAKECGALAVYVSGAGSTVMAVAERSGADAVYTRLEQGLEALEGLDGWEAFTLLRLDADNPGATVERRGNRAALPLWPLDRGWDASGNAPALPAGGPGLPRTQSGRHAEAKKGPGFPAGVRCTLEKEESDKYGVDRTKVRRLIGP